jgi:hypothetical protein
MTSAEWAEVFAVNVDATFVCWSEPSTSSARKTEFHPTSTSFGRFVPQN